MELCAIFLVEIRDTVPKIPKAAMERKFLFRDLLLSEIVFLLDVYISCLLVTWEKGGGERERERKEKKKGCWDLLAYVTRAS